jgi:hypothetical protein
MIRVLFLLALLILPGCATKHAEAALPQKFMVAAAHPLAVEAGPGMSYTPICRGCRHFMKLPLGYAGICGLQQRELEWNEAMAIVSDDDSCEHHEERK